MVTPMKQHPLVAWRHKQGITAYQFAAKARMGASYLSKIERWHVTPSLTRSVNLARLTGWAVRPEQFLPEFHGY